MKEKMLLVHGSLAQLSWVWCRGGSGPLCPLPIVAFTDERIPVLPSGPGLGSLLDAAVNRALWRWAGDQA